MKRILALASVLALIGCGGGGGGDSSSDPRRPPLETKAGTVSFTYPANNETGVPTSVLIIASFSEDKDAATITGDTFSVSGVAGTVSYDAASRTAQLLPVQDLEPNTRYTVTMGRGVKNAAGSPMPADYTWSFTTAAAPDLKCASVVSIDTAHGTAGTALNSAVSVTFSEVMTPATLNESTLILADSAGAPVAGTVSYSGRTATFTPAQGLQPNASYTATVTAAAQDLSGNSLCESYSRAISTSGSPDTTGPAVNGTSPARNAVGVAVNRLIAVSFTEVVDPRSITTETFTITQGSLFLRGTVASFGSLALFFPSAPLAPNSVYTVTVTNGVKDLAGNRLPQSDTWSFTTAAEDKTPALLASTVPANNATGVPVTTVISATFNEDMNPFASGTIDGLPATVAYDFASRTYTLIPGANLAANARYTITGHLADLAGNLTTISWEFTTGP